MTSLEDQQALLLYRVGPVLCCAPSLHVLSIIQPVSLTHPPGTDAARPGIFRHGGHVIKTEDLRVRFGVEEADRKPGRMVIAEVDSGRTAFWVDEIIDVISMPTTGWGQLPPHLPKGIFSRTLLLKDKIYLYAEFDGLHKLQGHGLLKAYIEQLMTEQQPARAQSHNPMPDTKLTEPPKTDRQKPGSQNSTSAPPEKDQIPAPSTTSQKQVQSNGTKPAAPISKPDKVNVTTPQSPAIKPTTRPASPTPRHTSNDKVDKKPVARTDKPAVANRPSNTPLKTTTTETHQTGSASNINKPPVAPTPTPVGTPASKINQTITSASPPEKANDTSQPWMGILLVLLVLAAAGSGQY